MFTIFNRNVPAALCLVTALFLTGCGSDEQGSGDGGGEAPPPASQPTEDESASALTPMDDQPAHLGTDVSSGVQPASLVDTRDERAQGGRSASSGALTASSRDAAGMEDEESAKSTAKSDEKKDEAEGKAEGTAESKSDEKERQKTKERDSRRGISTRELSGESAATSASGGLTKPGRRNPEGGVGAKPDPSAYFINVEPASLEMGEFPTEETAIGTVKLVNTSDETVTCKRPRSNCGCTTAGLKEGTVLEPGQSVDVEIRLRSGPTPRRLSKTVTFSFEPEGVHPPLRVPVIANSVAFVTIDPTRLNPEESDEARFTVRSIDDQPFRVTSMIPAIIEEFPEEAKVQHEIVFDWESWEAMGHVRKAQFFTDHPKCKRVFLDISSRFRGQREVMAQPQRRPGQMQTRPSPSAGSVQTEAGQTVRRTPPPRTIDDLIKAGQSDDVQRRIESGEVKVDTRDPSSGTTVLGLAAKHGDLGLMRYLIEAGAVVEAPDRVGRTPLMYAVQTDNLEAIRLLIESGAQLETKDNIGGTALCWAAGFGKAAAVRELIDQGAKVEVVGAFTGFTPLIWAAGFGDPDSIPVLLEAGADVEATDLVQGATPLMHAARTGKPEAIRLLVEHGANLESRDRTGQTAYLAACAGSGGTVDKIQALLDAGADKSAKEDRGQGALDLARRRTDLNSEAVIEMLERLYAAEGASSAEASGT